MEKTWLFFVGMVVFLWKIKEAQARENGDGDVGIPGDENSRHSSQGLNSKRKGSHIEQNQFLDITAEHSSLNGGTDGDALEKGKEDRKVSFNYIYRFMYEVVIFGESFKNLIRVDSFVGLSSEEGLDGLLDLGHTGHTTDEQHIVDLAGGESSIL